MASKRLKLTPQNMTCRTSQGRAEAWYYTEPKRLTIVTELGGKDGRYLGTVVAEIPLRAIRDYLRRVNAK